MNGKMLPTPMKSGFEEKVKLKKNKSVNITARKNISKEKKKKKLGRSGNSKNKWPRNLNLEVHKNQ